MNKSELTTKEINLLFRKMIDLKRLHRELLDDNIKVSKGDFYELTRILNKAKYKLINIINDGKQ